jgi:predicted nucleic acid-binding protein
MTGIFVDSFYFIALLNPHDRFHRVAVEVTRSFDIPLVTTSWILVETADALASPGIRNAVFRFLHDVWNTPRMKVLTEPEWYEQGVLLYGARLDKEWSLTDCISFSAMKSLNLHSALTADHHFEQAGFLAVLREP